jgi:hypothetical protein
MEITREQSKKITELIRLSDGESAKLSQYGDEELVHVAVKHTALDSDHNTKRITVTVDGKVVDGKTRSYRAKDGYWGVAPHLKGDAKAAKIIAETQKEEPVEPLAGTAENHTGDGVNVDLNQVQA